MKNERLYSLDLLRGMDMLLLTVIGPIVGAINTIWGLPSEVMYQFNHPWLGFTCWDMIMPLFIFMCGAAIPFALERRLASNGGHANAAYWKHVIGRFVLLWFLGMLVQGRLTSLNMDNIRLYDNTLESIAVGYLAVALAILIPNRKIVAAIPIVCFVLYGLMLHFLGDYSMNGNFAAVVEQGILQKIVPATSQTMNEILTRGVLADPSKIEAWVLKTGSEIHYTWYLTSLMFVFMAFCGYYSTKILTASASQWTKAKRLFVLGVSLLGVGLVLQFAGVPLIKHIFTVSFTAEAMGISVLLLTAFYVIADIWQFRYGTWLAILFGQFALWAYLTAQIFRPATYALATNFLGGIPHLIGTDRYQPLIMALAMGVEIVLVLMIRRALKNTAKK